MVIEFGISSSVSLGSFVAFGEWFHHYLAERRFPHNDVESQAGSRLEKGGNVRHSRACGYLLPEVAFQLLGGNRVDEFHNPTVISPESLDPLGGHLDGEFPPGRRPAK